MEKLPQRNLLLPNAPITPFSTSKKSSKHPFRQLLSTSGKYQCLFIIFPFQVIKNRRISLKLNNFFGGEISVLTFCFLYNNHFVHFKQNNRLNLKIYFHLIYVLQKQHPTIILLSRLQSHIRKSMVMALLSVD